MEGLCNRLGAGHRASWVCEGCEEGYVAHSTLERVGHVPARVFAEWWLLEDVASALNNFLRASFHGTEVVERHERTFRFRLPSTSSLGVVFERLERSRLDLGVEEYGISQTSLEQIFNEFASKQEEETTLVRGLQGSQKAGQPWQPTVVSTGSLEAWQPLHPTSSWESAFRHLGQVTNVVEQFFDIDEPFFDTECVKKKPCAERCCGQRHTEFSAAEEANHTAC